MYLNNITYLEFFNSFNIERPKNYFDKKYFHETPISILPEI
jgi:hypothetical protein